MCVDQHVNQYLKLIIKTLKLHIFCKVEDKYLN